MRRRPDVGTWAVFWGGARERGAAAGAWERGWRGQKCNFSFRPGRTGPAQRMLPGRKENLGTDINRGSRLRRIRTRSAQRGSQIVRYTRGLRWLRRAKRRIVRPLADGDFDAQTKRGPDRKKTARGRGVRPRNRVVVGTSAKIASLPATKASQRMPSPLPSPEKCRSGSPGTDSTT